MPMKSFRHILLLISMFILNSPIYAIWLSVDPLSDKYPHISPYAYSGNNPIKYVDPDGMDIYVFDENGYYIEKRAKEGTHYGALENNNQLDFTFEFADPIHDPQSIDEGKINHLFVVNDTQISSILTESGVENMQNKRDKYSFALRESNSNNIQGNGLMDYVITGKYNNADIVNYGNSLFITDVNGKK